MSKYCPSCKKTLDISCFGLNKSEKCGLQSSCKSCRKVRYAANRPAILKRLAEYRVANKERKAAYDKQRRLEKGDELRAYDRNRNKNPDRVAKSLAWQKNNPEARRVIRGRHQKTHWKEIYERHKVKFILSAAKRRAQLHQAMPCWYSEFDEFVFDEAAVLATLREQSTGIRWEIDHIVPLKGRRVSGLHCGTNMQVIPQAVNRWKSNKLLQSQAPHFEIGI